MKNNSLYDFILCFYIYEDGWHHKSHCPINGDNVAFLFQILINTGGKGYGKYI